MIAAASSNLRTATRGWRSPGLRVVLIALGGALLGGQAQATAAAGPVPAVVMPGAVPAVMSDLVAGAPVHAVDGSPIGTVQRVSGGFVMLVTDRYAFQLPASTFFRDGQGLVIAATAAGLDATVDAMRAAAASAASGTPQ